MNFIAITGRMVRDFEVRQTASGTLMAKGTVAVDSGFGDNKRTDFIPITTFGKKAEYCEKWLKKGRLVEVVGSLKLGQYTKKDGTKAGTTEIMVDDIHGLGSENSNNVPRVNAPKNDQGEQVENFSQLDEDIPF